MPVHLIWGAGSIGSDFTGFKTMVVFSQHDVSQAGEERLSFRKFVFVWCNAEKYPLLADEEETY